MCQWHGINSVQTGYYNGDSIIFTFIHAPSAIGKVKAVKRKARLATSSSFFKKSFLQQMEKVMTSSINLNRASRLSVTI